MFGTTVQLAQHVTLAFSTSAGSCFKGSDLAEHIYLEMGFSTVELQDVSVCIFA